MSLSGVPSFSTAWRRSSDRLNVILILLGLCHYHSRRPRCESLSFPGHLHEQLVAGLHFREAVVAEFFNKSAGNLEGDDIFDDDAGRGDGAHVAALVGGGFRSFRVEVDGLEWLAKRADRF